MKVKILISTLKSYWYSDRIGEELAVSYIICDRDHPFRYSGVLNEYLVKYTDAVITELPESFCVKRCDDKDKWKKYIQWLNKTCKNDFSGNAVNLYYGLNEGGGWNAYMSFGTEIHIDDMIKHIDYVESLNTNYVDANGEPFVIGAWYKLLNSPIDEYRKCCKLPNNDSLEYLEGLSAGKYFSSSNYGYTSGLYRLRRVEDSEVEKFLTKEEFDLTTNEGRLAYARKHYPIGTKVISLFHEGNLELIIDSTEFIPARKNGIQVNARKTPLLAVVYEDGKWAEIIKEEDQEFDLTTNEGRLAYAIKYYPIGTKYIPLYSNGESWNSDAIKIISCDIQLYGIDKLAFGYGYIYANGKWAEIIKEEVKETNMETQKLSRKGLKEIHSVACIRWKRGLEHYGTRNPLEDYIELTREEVNTMFNECTKEQLPIVSKYLKQDDGSVGLSFINSKRLLEESYDIIGIIDSGDYGYKSFWLTDKYNWEIKKDSNGKTCLIPTKKK